MSKRLPRAVLLLGFVSFFTDVSSEMILPLLPALVLSGMGASPLVLGLLDGIADALSAVLKRMAGQLSDRAPRRKPFLLVGYGLSAAVRPVMGFAASPVHAVLVRAFDRVGKGLRSAPRDALLSDAVAPDDAQRAFAYHRTMDHAGAVVGPLVAAGLLAWGLSVSNTMKAAWLPGAVAFLVLLVVRETPRALPATTTAVVSGARTPAQTRLLLTIALFCVASLPDLFLLLRARELALSEATMPLLWVALHVAKVLAAHASGTIKRYRDVCAVAFACVAAGALVLLWQHAAAVWIGAAVLGLGHGLREPAEKSLVRALSSDATRGGAFGTYHLVSGFGALGAGLLLGGVWTQSGHVAALSVSAVLTLVAAVLMARRES